MAANQSNPLVPQGTLNRVLASVQFPNNSTLNVTSPYLTKAGISLSFDGDATKYIPTMTGAVTSGEPYLIATLTLNLVKTAGLAALYKAQIENTTILGPAIIQPDTMALPTYQLANSAIESMRELPFTGEEAGFVITIKGIYNINAALWNLT